MERFELSIIAQGTQSVWVAVIVIALACVTVVVVTVCFATVKYFASDFIVRVPRKLRTIAPADRIVVPK